jgi:hypothetical protein
MVYKDMDILFTFKKKLKKSFIFSFFLKIKLPVQIGALCMRCNLRRAKIIIIYMGALQYWALSQIPYLYHILTPII